MKHESYTKIVATLGPSSNSPEIIEKLLASGADVFRLNFSHGTHDYHKATYDTIREIEKKLSRPISIVMDLQGPKLRVGKFKDDKIAVKPGHKLRLDLSKELGDETRVNLPHKEIFEVMQVGQSLLINDGKVKLKVLNCGKDFADTEVVYGTEISNNKGVNVPDVVLPISALTEKDRKDLEFGLGLGVDWVALSFVQRPEDVEEAKQLIDGRAWLISKLEKPSVLEHLEEIISKSDGIMVARGDLGVECPLKRVPVLQKTIIRACRKVGRPVIVATQMLESMIDNPVPTRAEASDVATAVYEGADAVMLSAETAAGKYPVEAVTMMDSIINEVEEDVLYRQIMDSSHFAPEDTGADAVTNAARQVAMTLKKAAAIVTYTMSGSTAMRAARERPCLPILCLTPSQKVARKMALVWGTCPVISSSVDNFAAIEEKAIRHAINHKLAKPGHELIITAGHPFGKKGTTNILRIAYIDPEKHPDVEPASFE